MDVILKPQYTFDIITLFVYIYTIKLNILLKYELNKYLFILWTLFIKTRKFPIQYINIKNILWM